jgi:hypothetical protein
MSYRIKLNPATKLPIETRKYTLWRVRQFLGPEYDEEQWEEEAGNHYGRRRAVLLYAVRECEKDPRTNRHDQLVQEMRKYLRTQPLFWPRFLRERYICATITDFFSVPYDDVRDEFYKYEDQLEELGADPRDTGRVFDPLPHIRELKAQIKRLGDNMDMNKAIGYEKPKDFQL